MNRKVIRSIVYIAVFITFPHLPLGGVKVLFELVEGVVTGSKEGVTHQIEREVTDELHQAKDAVLKPFGIIPELFHKFNPFQ